MSIKIKKMRFIAPFLLVGLSHLAFGGTFEQEQIDSVVHAFLQTTQQKQAKQEKEEKESKPESVSEGTQTAGETPAPAPIEAPAPVPAPIAAPAPAPIAAPAVPQASDYELFKERVKAAAEALESWSQGEAHEFAEVLRSLHAKLVAEEDVLKVDCKKFSTTVATELSGVSEHMKDFLTKFRQHLGDLEESAAANAAIAEKRAIEAAGIAAAEIEADAKVAKVYLSEWGSWVYIQLNLAKDAAIADWHALAKLVASHCPQFGEDHASFGQRIQGALHEGKIDSEQFFQSLAEQLEKKGGTAYQGIKVEFSRLGNDIKQDFDATIDFFLGHTAPLWSDSEDEVLTREVIIHENISKQEEAKTTHETGHETVQEITQETTQDASQHLDADKTQKDHNSIQHIDIQNVGIQNIGTQNITS
jgi:hypothetical protein